MKLNFRKPLSRKTFLLLLAAAAVLVAALVLLAGRLPDFLSSVLCFPLEPVACGLKRLAGTGSFGNGLAAALWIGLSVIPAAARASSVLADSSASPPRRNPPRRA